MQLLLAQEKLAPGCLCPSRALLTAGIPGSAATMGC